MYWYGGRGEWENGRKLSFRVGTKRYSQLGIDPYLSMTLNKWHHYAWRVGPNGHEVWMDGALIQVRCEHFFSSIAEQEIHVSAKYQHHGVKKYVCII